MLVVRCVAAVVVATLAWAGALASPDPSACRQVVFEGDGFTICTYSPRLEELRLASRGRGGPLGDFDGLSRSLGRDAGRVDFAMNAGMYGRDQRPIGLWVEAGRRAAPLNRAGGSGNFYLKPNGVFWVDAKGAPRVTETEAFAKSKLAPRWATQSGPLLVKDGAIDAWIAPNGLSRVIRNGVCVRDRVAFFAISDGPVSFGRLARLFRDSLGCQVGLYLDGAVSSLWAPGLGRRDDASGLGTFIVTLRRAK